MTDLDDAGSLQKAAMALLRAKRAINELLRVAHESAEAVTAIRAALDAQREATNRLASAVRRAQDNAAALQQSIK